MRLALCSTLFPREYGARVRCKGCHALKRRGRRLAGEIFLTALRSIQTNEKAIGFGRVK